jgi:hypothetical protein
MAALSRVRHNDQMIHRFASAIVLGLALSGCAAHAVPSAAQQAHHEDPPAGVLTVWTDVPVEFDGVYFYTRFTIQGSGPHWFLVDTGCTTTVVDKTLAAELGLRLGPAADPAPGPVRSIIEDPGLDHQVLSFSPALVWAIEVDRGVSPMTGRRVRGILGADFFEEHVVELDYERGTMRISNPSDFRAEPTDLAVPLVGAGVRWVAAILTPQAGESFGHLLMLDTGYTGDVELDAASWKRFGLPGDAPTVSAAGRSIAGDWEGLELRLGAIDLGPLRLEGPTMGVVLSDPSGKPTKPAGLSFLGAEVLRKFTVTFDFSRARVLLRPNALFGERFEANTTGLALLARDDALDRLVVFRVRPDSPAQRAGLLVNDEIIAVDGRPASDFSPVSLRRYLQKAIGRPVVLRLRRGLDEFEATLVPMSAI